MTELPKLRAGIYRHYKDHFYLVLGYARDSNDETRTVVVYVGLDLDGAKSGERMLVRTAEEFLGFVDPSTGEAVPTGIRRFTYHGPSMQDLL
jgi:hypothetical protein